MNNVTIEPFKLLIKMVKNTEHKVELCGVSLDSLSLLTRHFL